MKLKKTLAIFGAIPFLFSACSQSVSSSSDERDIMADLFPEMEHINNEYEAELYFNYEMLDLFYIYAHMRNELADDYKVYLNKGTSQDSRTKGYCSADYGKSSTFTFWSSLRSMVWKASIKAAFV